MSDQVDRQLTKHGLDLTQSSRLVKVRYGAAKGASHVIAVSTVKDIHGELMQYIKDEVPGVLRVGAGMTLRRGLTLLGPECTRYDDG